MIDDELRAVGLPALGRHAWVEVDVGCLSRSVARLRGAIPGGTRLGIVVKADAYGHGLEMVSAVAARAGADVLCVATLEEARRVRRLGLPVPVLVLFPVPPDELAGAAAEDIEVTIASDPPPSVLRALPAVLAVHLEVDTGMSRGGAAPGEVPAIVADLAASPRVRLAGLWTHLAAPEDPATTAQQVAAFEHVLAALRAARLPVPPCHLASSGAVLLRSAPLMGLVRIGIATYGVIPDEFSGGPGTLALEPALSLKAHALRIEPVLEGTPVGYGGEWRAPAATRIATLPLGYADGVDRGSWPGMSVLVRGRRVPLVGRVSMDALGIDLAGSPDATGSDEVVLIGAQGADRVTAQEVARVRRTIAWEVLATLSGRLPRVYRDAGRILALRPADTRALTWASGQEPSWSAG